MQTRFCRFFPISRAPRQNASLCLAGATYSRPAVSKIPVLFTKIPRRVGYWHQNVVSSLRDFLQKNLTRFCGRCREDKKIEEAFPSAAITGTADASAYVRAVAGHDFFHC